MAKYGAGSSGFLLVGGYNLLASKVFDLSGPSIAAVLEESHGLGDAWHESLPVGLRRATLSQNGLFDDDTTAINAALTGGQQTSKVVSVAFTGGAVGQKFVGCAGAFGGVQSRVASRGALTRMNVDYTVTGAVEEGVILQALATKTADWNTEGAESVDNAASSANGGAGYLHVTAYSGFTNLVGKIRHSADDVTYADLLTFTTVTAIGAERVTVAGTVNRHLAFDGNVTGAGSVTVMAGFARG